MTVSFVDAAEGSYDEEQRHVALPRALRFAIVHETERAAPESDDSVSG